MPDGPIDINLGGVGDIIVNAIKDRMGELASTAWNSFTLWLYGGLRALFLEMFRMTLLTIPHALTDTFRPVVQMLPDPLLLVGAAASLSMILLGLKVILQRVPMQSAIVEGVIGRLVIGVALIGAMPWLVARAIDVEQQLAESISMEAVEAIVIAPVGPLDFSVVIALVIMIFLGIRLWFKLAANVVHIAAALTWSPLAGVCSLFPPFAWVTSTWWREVLGRLAGAVLATIAVGIGLALALGYPGFLSIAGGGGAFIAAADAVDWLTQSPGQRSRGVLGTAFGGVQAGLALARGTGAGAATAAVGEAIPRNEIATRAEMYGFD